jgi:hypothetical protein
MSEKEMLLRFHHIPAPTLVSDSHGDGWQITFSVNRLLAQRGPGGQLPHIPPDPVLRIYPTGDSFKLRWLSEPMGNGIGRETFEEHAVGMVRRKLALLARIIYPSQAPVFMAAAPV